MLPMEVAEVVVVFREVDVESDDRLGLVFWEVWLKIWELFSDSVFLIIGSSSSDLVGERGGLLAF